jgi:DNA polymerase-3 subunit gamma/tau
VSYLVLARKYRPQSFEDLVGQEHVTKTLANAIAQDRVAHAFLFTGVRGVGKTTSARILAKCLNCLGADGKATGPTATPCQVCAACTEIAAGVDMDVQEIDAASYTGIDDVRALQSGLAFRPARDRFKIYVVDEVHMLSMHAWNAFLKTLEEPPPHVKFIFATTEVQKVPVTILSRCQRYDFKLVSARQIGERLKDVLGKESLEAEDAAISVVAREAAGSMRDAMSLLDQVIAYGSAKITAEDVARVLGVADREVMHQLSSALLAGDAATTLQVLDDVARQGFDLTHLCRDLLQHVRNLVVARVCPEAQARELLDLADEEVKDVLALAQRYDADDLSRVFGGLSKGFDEIVKSGQVRAALEITLVRLARRPALLPLDELLARLGELEKRLATGAPPPPRGGTSGGGGAGGARSSGAGAPGGASREPAHASPPSSGATHGGATHGSAAHGGATHGGATQGGVLASAAAAPPLSVVPPLAPARPLAQARADEADAPAVALGSLALAEPEARRDARPEATPVPSSAVVESGDTISLWRALLERVRRSHKDVAPTLELAVPVVVTRERVVLGFEQGSFEDRRAESVDAQAILTEHARAFFGGASTKVSFEVAARGTKSGSVAYLDLAKKKQAQLEARAAVEKHDLVQAAIGIFEAELKDVKLPAQEE